MNERVINTLPVEMEEERELVPASQIAYRDFIRPNVHDDFDGIDERVAEARAQVEKSVAVLSLEGLAVFERGYNMAKGFVGKLKYILYGIGSTVDLLVRFGNKPAADERNYKKFISFAEKNDYYAIAERVRLYQVARLGVGWLEYVNGLAPHVKIAANIDEDVLKPYTKYIADALNKPSVLSSGTHKGAEMRKDVDGQQASLRKLFNGKLNEFVSWGQAFKNNGECLKMFEVYSELQKEIKRLKPKDVREMVKRLSETAESLFTAIEEEREGFVLNKAQLQNLSEGLFATAKYVEYYTVIVQLMYEFDTCLAVSQAKQLK